MSRKYTCHHAATRRAYDLTMLPEETAGLAVEVLDLVKRYPKSPVNAVDGVSFAASPGEVFGLLGPNGGYLDACEKRKPR